MLLPRYAVDAIAIYYAFFDCRALLRARYAAADAYAGFSLYVTGRHCTLPCLFFRRLIFSLRYYA